MRVVPTQKLYFKKYSYCVKMTITNVKTAGEIRGNKTVSGIRSFLAKMNTPVRTRLDWFFSSKNKIEVVFSVYLNDDDLYKKILDEYNKLVTWVSKPICTEHKELLLANTEIIFREKLLYGRFRYKVYFNVGWKREYLPEVNGWIKSQFGHKEEGRQGEYMWLGYWNPSLYLIDNDDLIMVKLSLSERISTVVRVDKLSDYGLTKESLDAP